MAMEIGGRSIWSEINQWMGWGLGNGCSVKFWADRWIYGRNLIEEAGEVNIGEIMDQNRPVRDYISKDGNWNWNAFAGKIGNSSLLAIASIKPPVSSSIIPGFHIWVGTKSGDYSVATTYANLISWWDVGSCGLGGI